MNVLHSFPIWLPLTQNWLYRQVYHLPEHVSNHIVCKEVQNSNVYGLPNTHSMFTKPNSKLASLTTRLFRQMDYHFYVRIKTSSIQPDIIHSHFGPVGWRNALFVKSSAKKITTFYGQDATQLPAQQPKWKDRYQQLFKTTDAVFCEGTFMASTVAKLGCPEGKIKVQHLGVDLDSLPFHPRSRDEKQPLRILIAASFREKKGIPIALKAIAKIKNDINVEISIIGDASDDPDSKFEKQKILETIDQHNLRSDITFLGFQSHEVMIQTALKHDIFMSTSVHAKNGDSEGGIPVGIIEMAATGMPVISSYHCDIPSVIRHKETGWLAEEHNIDQIADGIRFLYENPDQWKKLAINARSLIESEYNAKIQGQKLADRYNEVLHE